MTDPSRVDDPYDCCVRGYDAWFDASPGREIFAAELASLRRVEPLYAGRWLEVGVGTGRFAQALNVGEGVDPSLAMLRLAELRGIAVAHGAAESLPYETGLFDGILLVTTLCFLRSPAEALGECARVLREDGSLVAGIIPADSPWGAHYTQLGMEGHPLYSSARFLTTRQLQEMVEQAGFRLERAASTLFCRPDEVVTVDEALRGGVCPEAGFVALSWGLST